MSDSSSENQNTTERELSKLSQVVAETASDAILTIDEGSTILFVNRAAEKIFGYAPEELIGKSLTILMPDYLRHIHRAGIERYVKTGERQICWEHVSSPVTPRARHE